MSSKELLAEYAKLAAKLQHINETLQEMNAVDISQLIDKIRIVERKMGLVYTLFKSSVYAVTMQETEQEQGAEQGYLREQEQRRRYSNGAQYQSTEPDRRYLQDQEQQDQHLDLQQQQQQQQQHYQSYSIGQGSDRLQLSQPLSSSQQQQPQQQQHEPQQQQQQLQLQQQQQLQQAQRRQSYGSTPQSRRSSMYNDIGNILRRSGSRPPLRTSNAREEYQAATGNKSVLSLSRGYSSRWSHALLDNHTNRPRY